MTYEQQEALKAWVLEVFGAGDGPSVLAGRWWMRLPQAADRTEALLRWGILNVEGDRSEPLASFSDRDRAEQWLRGQKEAGEASDSWQVFPYVAVYWFRNEIPPRELEGQPVMSGPSEPRPKRWCRCAHLLARHLYARAELAGACYSGEWWDEDCELRRTIVREAEDALNWVGRCRCRERASP